MQQLLFEYVDARCLGFIRKKFIEASKKVITEASKIIKDEVKQTILDESLIASGKLHKSIKRRVRTLRSGYSATVFVDPSVSYAGAVIRGQSAGTLVDIENIKTWIKQKQMRGRSSFTSDKYTFWYVTDKTIDRVAYNIVKSIERKGTKGTNFMSIALKNSVQKVGKMAREIFDDIYSEVYF